MKRIQAVLDLWRALNLGIDALGRLGDSTVANKSDTRERYSTLVKCPWCDLTQMVGGAYGEVATKRQCADWQNCGGTVSLQDAV